MVGAAGFPCGIFPDVKILRAGPRGFCLARKVPFFCAQTKTSLRPSPPDAGKQFACSVAQIKKELLLSNSFW